MTDRDIILQKTNGGFDVFVHYMGECCNKKMFCNPFRTDNAPSCHLYYHEDRQGGEGRFILKDFGDSAWYGDCFWLVGHLCNLDTRTDFAEILRVIDRELCLFVFDDSSAVTVRPVKEKVQHDRVVDGRPVKFVPRYRNFNKHELAYWSSFGITLSLLDLYHVRSLTCCSFERADGTCYSINSTIDVPMFGYTFFEGAGIKVYRPGADIGRFMYAGMLPKPYIFGMDQLSDRRDYVIVTGGEKDVLSLAAHGFDAICLNSETAKLPLEVIESLVGRYKGLVFLYDCDETGLRESQSRMNDWNAYMWKKGLDGRFPAFRVVLPLSGTKQDKDISDFFKSGNSSSALHRLILSVIQEEMKK